VLEAQHPSHRSLDDVDDWASVAKGLRAHALDCLQTSFGLIADRAHGAGAHLAMGARCGLETRAGNRFDGLRPTLDDRLAEAGELLGLRAVARWSSLDGPELRRSVAETTSLYVVGDAFHLPWGPYAGHESMAHSFVLLAQRAGRYTVIDAYHNDTAWGPARPGTWQLSAEELDAAVAAGADALALEAGPRPTLEVPTVLADNAERLRNATPAIRRYLAAARSQLPGLEGIERLVLDIWLLSRERTLHVEWLADVGQPHAAAAEQARQWQRLATQSYIALRRARRGEPAEPGVLDRVTELFSRDVELAGQRADVARAHPVHEAVLDALRGSLNVDDETVRTSATLRDLPGFTSFRLVDVIERVERRLGIELAPGAIVAANLSDLAGLCRLFQDACPARERDGSPGERPSMTERWPEAP